MLWLSAALHAAVIGLTRLPKHELPVLPPELQVSLQAPQPLEHSPVAKPEPEPKPVELPPQKQVPVTKPVAVQPAPVQPVVAPQPLPAPVRQTAQAPAASVASAPASPVAHDAPGPKINIPVAVDTHYYVVKELDMPPTVLRKPAPVYPPQAEDQGISGRVVLRLYVEHDGSVGKTEVLSVSPGGVFGEMFKKSALEAFSSMRFRPSRRNSQPVRAVVEIPVTFEPDS